MIDDLNLFEDEIPAVDITVTNVVEYLLENSTFLSLKKEDLIKNVAGKFLVTNDSASEKLKAALKEIKKIENTSFNASLKKALRDRELIFIKAMKTTAGLRTALEAAKDRDMLKGLYDNSITVKGVMLYKDIDLLKLTDEQLERIANGETPEKVIAASPAK